MTRQSPLRRPPGFTLVEMLVVIGIIVVLMAILVPVVSRMRIAVQTANTNAQLQRISAAINAYFNDFRGYPGITPNALFNPTTPGSPPRVVANLTQSEDLVLALLGGLKVTGSAGTGYNVAWDTTSYTQVVGQGPVTINPRNVGKKNPYLAKVEGEISRFPIPGTNPPEYDGQMGGKPNVPEFDYVKDANGNPDTPVPEFMDLYPDPRPILYLRCNPGIQKWNAAAPASQRALGPKGQFNSAQFGYNWDTIEMYLKTSAKGFNDKTGDFAGRVPTNAGAEPEINRFFTAPSGELPRNANGYLLISAGPDRRFGTGDDIVFGSGGGQ